jgi:hypothetical protein
VAGGEGTFSRAASFVTIPEKHTPQQETLTIIAEIEIDVLFNASPPEEQGCIQTVAAL